MLSILAKERRGIMGEKSESRNKYICIVCVILGIVAFLYLLYEGVNYINSPMVNVHKKLTNHISEFKSDKEKFDEKVDYLMRMYRDTELTTYEEVLKSDDVVKEIKKTGIKLDNEILGIYEVLSKNEKYSSDFSYLSDTSYSEIYKLFKDWKEDVIKFKNDLLKSEEIGESERDRILTAEYWEQVYLIYIKYISSCKNCNENFLNEYSSIYNSDLNSANTSLTIITVCFAIGLICLIITSVLYFKGRKQKKNAV